NALKVNQACMITSREASKLLADWFDSIPARELTSPWAQINSRWKAVVAEMLLERASLSLVRMLWPLIDSLPDAHPNKAIPEETLEMIFAVFFVSVVCILVIDMPVGVRG